MDRYVPGHEVEGQQLSSPVIAVPLAHVRIRPGCERQISAGWLVFPRRRGAKIADGRVCRIGGEAGRFGGQDGRVDGVEEERVEGLEYDVHVECCGAPRRVGLGVGQESSGTRKGTGVLENSRREQQAYTATSQQLKRVNAVNAVKTATAAIVAQQLAATKIKEGSV